MNSNVVAIASTIEKTVLLIVVKFKRVNDVVCCLEANDAHKFNTGTVKKTKSASTEVFIAILTTKSKVIRRRARMCRRL